MQFEANVRILTPYFSPSLLAYLREISPSEFHVIKEDDDFRVMKGTTECAPDTERKYAKRIVENYNSNPSRLYFSDEVIEKYCAEAPLREGDFAGGFIRELYGIHKDKIGVKKNGDGLSSAFICFGLGLGFQLVDLYESSAAIDLIICDYTADCLFYSLHLYDWQAIVEQIKGRGGQIYFLLANDPEFIATTLLDLLRHGQFTFLEGTYIYRHYDDTLSNQVMLEFRKRFPNLLTYNGWLEDDNIHLSNALTNITQKQATVVLNKASKTELPVVIVGSGPSLDDSVDAIKRIQGQCIIISAGTALKPLLEYGIRPDFHCELENGQQVGWVLTELSQKFDLSEIILLASITVSPAVPDFFNQSLFFLREGDGTIKWLAGENPQLNHSVPSCTNAAMRMAIQFGFQNIYLFGMDFGSANSESHHSKLSIYNDEVGLADKKIRNIIKGNLGFSITTRGNLREVIYTKPLHNLMRFHLEKLIADFPDEIVTNFSDGALIAGTKTGYLESLDLQISSNKEEMKSRIIQFYIDSPQIEFVSRNRLTSFHEDFVEWFNVALKKLNQPYVNFSELVYGLASVIDINASDEKEHLLSDAVKSVMSGSMYKMLHAINFMYVRREKSLNGKFFLDDVRARLSLHLHEVKNSQDEYFSYLDYVLSGEHDFETECLNKYLVFSTFNKLAFEHKWDELDKRTTFILQNISDRAEILRFIEHLYALHIRTKNLIEIASSIYANNVDDYAIKKLMANCALFANRDEFFKENEDWWSIANTSVALRARVGLSALWNGDVTRAEKYILSAYSEASSDETSVLNSLGALRIVQGKLEEGMALLERSLILSPNNFIGLIEKSYGLFKAGAYTELFKISNFVTALDPYQGDCRYFKMVAAGENILESFSTDYPYAWARLQKRLGV